MAKDREKEEADRLKKEKKAQQLQKKIEVQEKKKEQELKKIKRLQEKANCERQKRKVTKKIKTQRKSAESEESEESDCDNEVMEMMSDNDSVSTSSLEDKEPISTDVTDVKPTTPKKIGKPICVEDWVLVLYNGVEYPGCVVSIKDTDYEVKTFESVVYCRKQMWRWPDREDKIFYPEEDIIRVLQAPTPFKGEGRRANLYEFLE